MKALLASLTLLAGTVGDAARTQVESRSSVPADMDHCLDHSVKELGMSAKRNEGERAWTIGPQFLHPAIAKDGALALRFEKGADRTTIRVTASWPGAPKDGAAKVAIESRMRAIARKVSQLCGVVHPAVECELTPAGAARTACGPDEE